MSTGLLIIAHANLGTCMLKQAESNLGPMPMAVKVLEVYPNDDPKHVLTNAISALKGLESGDGVLILTDLFGATPSNIAHQLVSNEALTVVHGLNLAMLVRAHNYSALPLEQLTQRVVDGARDSVFAGQPVVANRP